MEATQTFSNFTEEAGFAQEQTPARSDSDPRPVYLFSPGDHIHRISARDSVPHVFAGQVQVVKNHIQWLDAGESMSDGVRTREITRGTKLVKQAGLPMWAGSIVNAIMRAHADVLVTTIEAFEGIPSDEIAPDEFNRLISGNEGFPYVIEPDWRVRDRMLNPLVPPMLDYWKRTPKKYLEVAAEKGGLAVRRALVVEGRKLTQRGQYQQAIEEVLAAYDRFASHGDLYLDEQERLIQSTKGETKVGYDPYDRYLLWLLGRKGIETARGLTREDMKSLMDGMKGGSQTSFSREDVATIAVAAARAAVESLPRTNTDPVQSAKPETLARPTATAKHKRQD